MRGIALVICLMFASGCAADNLQWTKPGASSADFQRDAYECERDTRAVSHTFSRGVLLPVLDAQEFAGRCMSSKGWYLASATPPATPVPLPQKDASGQRYDNDERVMCSFPKSDNPHLVKGVELGARPCAAGGGVILGAASGDKVRDVKPTSGRKYGDGEMVVCSLAVDMTATVKMKAGACSKSGGKILGPA